MNKRPIYQSEGDTIYYADDCDPLRQAVEDGNVILKAFVRGQYPGVSLPKDALPGLRTVGFWTVPARQDWGLDLHRNEGIEVTFMLGGGETYKAGERKWSLQAGDITICPPWQVHGIGDPNVAIGTLIWFILDTKIRRDRQNPRWPSWIVLSEQDKNELLPLLFFNSSRVFHLPEKYQTPWKNLYRIIKDSDSECPVSKLAILINEILYDLLTLQRGEKQDRPKEESHSEIMVRNFLRELETVPGQLEHPWTLREMARLCRISPARFSQYCRQYTNYSPLHTLNQMRVRRAQEMMNEDPNRSITDIAMRCGFTTSQYFATVFKKWTGQTPTEYRIELINKKVPHEHKNK